MGERKIDFTSIDEMFGINMKKSIDEDLNSEPNDDLVVEIEKMLDWHTEINLPGVRVHPFNRIPEEKRLELKKSIEKNGLISPIILRTDVRDGYYEVVAGHNRRDALRELGYSSLSTGLGQIRVLKECDDIKAAYWMLDSNIQREKVLPSERADAYSIKYALIKAEVKQNPDILSHYGTERTDEAAAKLMGISRTTLQRYLTLKKLLPEFMVMVDQKELTIPAAEIIASLNLEQQKALHEAVMLTKVPGISTVKQIKDICEERFLCTADLCEMIKPTKENKFSLKPAFKSIAKTFDDIEIPNADHVDQKELESVITEAIRAYLGKIFTGNQKTE